MTMFQSFSASENFRLARSKPLVTLADGTYDLIMIPKYAFVMNVWFQVTQAYAGAASGSATIGWKGNATTADPDGFMDAAWAAALVTGMKEMHGDTQPGSKGKWFSDGSGFLTITLSKGTDTTLLIGQVFMQFSVLH